MELERNIYKDLLDWKKNNSQSTLELSGARQVGKTFIVNKFADQEYERKIYINLLEFTGEIFLKKYNDLKEELLESGTRNNHMVSLIKSYDSKFIDDENTIIIIDEIQESADIYNRIREFTRELKSHVVVTGSYLGRILNKEFKYSAGDIVTLNVNTLSFEEFLMARGKLHLLEVLDIFKPSIINDDLSDEFDIYCKIGGYPKVVLNYLKNQSVEKCQEELIKIVNLFTRESRRYFTDILDVSVYENIFTSIGRELLREKKGLDGDSFSEDLTKIVVKEYSSKITKAEMNRAIDWLYSSGILAFAGKLVECNILEYKAKARCFFMDLGLAYYFLRKTGKSIAEINGVIAENFMFLDLIKRIEHPSSIALETPVFATFETGEIDFFVKSFMDDKSYAIEVKKGKNSGKTLKNVLKKNKTDYVVYAKGNTMGGIAGKMLTIPLYGVSKFHFDEKDFLSKK